MALLFGHPFESQKITTPYSPFVEGPLGFTLERREVVVSLGQKAGSIMEGLFTLVSALGAWPLTAGS